MIFKIHIFFPYVICNEELTLPKERSELCLQLLKGDLQVSGMSRLIGVPLLAQTLATRQPNSVIRNRSFEPHHIGSEPLRNQGATGLAQSPGGAGA